MGEESKGKPFEVFLKWLKKAGGLWKIVVTSGAGRAEKERREHHAFHMEVEGNRGSGVRYIERELGGIHRK